MTVFDPKELEVQAASRCDHQISPEDADRLRFIKFTYTKTYAPRSTLMAQAALNAN